MRTLRSSCDRFVQEDSSKFAVVLSQEFECDGALVLGSSVVDPYVRSDQHYLEHQRSNIIRTQVLRALRSLGLLLSDIRIHVVRHSETLPCDAKLWSNIWELAEIHKWPQTD